MKKVILISGKARSGKDYISDIIIKKLTEKNISAIKFALADELKKYLCILFGIDLDTLNKLKNSEEPFCLNGTTVRQILQRLGTDIFFNYVDYDYWIKVAGKKCDNENCEVILITDFRYPHEIKIKNYTECEVITVRVKSNNSLIKSSEHPSETSLDNFDFDYYISNEDFSKTEKNVETFIKEIING